MQLGACAYLLHAYQVAQISDGKRSRAISLTEFDVGYGIMQKYFMMLVVFVEIQKLLWHQFKKGFSGKTVSSRKTIV